MITDEELDNLPSDPDEAIVYLAEKLRATLRNYNTGERPGWDIEREYVNLLRGFVIEFEVPVSAGVLEEPPISDDEFGNFYHRFNVLIDQYIASTRIRIAIRRKQARLTLNATTKARIHHHISKIRKILNSLDIPIEKKDQIIDRLNHFAAAVDKERTDIRQILDIALEVADTGSEVAKKLVDVRKHLDAITGLLAEAREWARLALPWTNPKKLDSPRKQLPPPSEPNPDGLDDDIPF